MEALEFMGHVNPRVLFVCAKTAELYANRSTGIQKEIEMGIL